MSEPARAPRPERETFEFAGCRVSVVGASEILAIGTAERVEVSIGGRFPWPVRRVRLSVTATERGDSRMHEFHARIDTGRAVAVEVEPAVLGRDPIGAFLTHRVREGDRWAVRIVDSVGGAVVGLSRWLGRPTVTDPAYGGEATATVVRNDAATGVTASVTYRDVASDGGRSGPAGRVVTARATVPSPEVSPAHLHAMLRIVLGLVGDLAQDDPHGESLAGREYLVRRDAARRPAGVGVPVSLADIGGLDDVVAQFRQIAISFRHGDILARWGARRPQGILLYGPPGTGKTMLARALANEIGARMREIRTPEILDKWLGASERNIKRIFREARRYRTPTVLLFDEFDSIISYAGSGQDSGSQAINAVAGIFKQEMNDLIDDNPNVIVVATTNFPDRVDDSLIRSGRFDVKLAIPMPDAAARADIVTKMIGRLSERHNTTQFRMFAGDVDPAGLGAACQGMNGADIREVLRRVQLAKAMREAVTGSRPPPIEQADILLAIAEVQRSVPSWS
jgi:transitional endoplasmic reticulum ATPase